MSGQQNERHLAGSRRGLSTFLCALAVFLSFAANAQSPPAAPTGLTAAPLDAEASLAWTNPSDATITGYSVRHATSTTAIASGTWVAISSTSSTVAHTVRSLANGTRYYFQIRATNANGDSDPSNTATIQLADDPSAVVTISDSNLRTLLEGATGKGSGDAITQLDMAKLLAVVVSPNHGSVAVLTGLEHAVNVARINLYYSSVTDLTPLANLTSLTSLVLSGNSITDVTPLANLTSLTWLNLSGNSISNVTPLASLSSLTGLNLSGNSITDVTPLASLMSLTSLYLAQNSISNVTPLASLTSLTTLDLGNSCYVPDTEIRCGPNNNSITDVTPLASLTSLGWLYLSGNSISNVTPLASLTSLTWLNLSGNSITDVTPFATSTLRQLDLSDNLIADVTALVSSTSLTGLSLDLSRNPVSDLTELASLRVRKLTLSGHSITDVTPFATSTLRQLDLSNNLIMDVSPLASSTSLTWLDLTDNSITDVAALGSLTSLGLLFLGYNSITDVAALGSLTSLTNLSLGDNSITNVAALGSLTSLTSLVLANNSITDVAALSSLTSLRFLALNGNLITDLAPLESNAGLDRGDLLYVYYNPLSLASVTTHIPVLRGRGVGVVFNARPTSAPSAPSSLAAAVVASGARLSWTDPRDAYIERYELRSAASMAALASSAWATVSGSNSRTTEHVAPLAGDAYRVFELRAVNFNGAGAAASVAVGNTRGVTLSTSTLRVQENSRATYTVRLSQRPVGGNVTVAIGGAGSGITVSPTSLTFTSLNWSRARIVTVRARNDDNPTDESVTLTHTPTGADYGGATAAELEVTAVDDDKPRLWVTPTMLTVGEGSSTTYRVRLNALPTGNVTVTVGGATGQVTVDTDGDTTGNQSTLTFTPTDWGTYQEVKVSAAADDDATDEMLTLRHTAMGAPEYTGLSSGARPSVVVTVDDNDTPGLLIDADAGTPGLDAGPLALHEQSGHAANAKQYTVRLATEPTGTVQVSIESRDRAVSVDGDSTPRTRTLTFSTSNWSTAQTVTATATDDLDGGDEAVAIAHAATGGDYGRVSATLAATVQDDDPRGVVSAPVRLDEGTATSTTVRLATQPTGTVTVAITDDHADVTVDPPAMLTFDAATWQTGRTFMVRAGEDLDGQDETGTLTFDPRGADYGGVPSATSTMTVEDDDPRGVTLSESTLAVPEGNGAAYTVRLDTQPRGGSVTVAVGGAGSGISARPTALTFTPTNWRAAQTVAVSAAEDGNTANESVVLTHAVSGADYGMAGVAAGSVTATATDNDAPSLRVSPTTLALVEEGADGFYAVRLNTPPSGDVTVTVGGATSAVAVDTDGATPGSQSTLTFTTSTWSTAQRVTVSAPDDDDAADAAATLTHAVTGADYGSLAPEARPGVSVTVDDNDTPGLLIDADPGTPGLGAGPLALNEQPGHANNAKQYTVRLATEPTGAVQVSIESGDRAVSVDGDPTPRTLTLAFTTTNWLTPQTVTATAAQDDDASGERVAISHAASGGGYGGVSANLMATTVDDDTPALLLATSTLATSGVTEGSTTTYTVRLATEPSGTVRVAAAASGNSTGPVELDMDGGQAGLQSSLRFDAANWNVPRTATVRGLPDDDAEDGRATLGHSATGADYGGVSAAAMTFDVQDDDIRGILLDTQAWEGSPLAVNEGSTATYTARLTTRPDGAVTVTATSTNASVATVAPATLRFGAGDWNVPKTFRVYGVQAGSATTMHGASGGGYTSESAQLAVAVRDTQAAGVRIDPPQLGVREGTSGSYGVRLNTQPTASVTVTALTFPPALNIDGSVPTSYGSVMKTLTFTTGDWNVEQTVSVSAGQDDLVGAEYLPTVTHTVAGYAGVATAPDLVVLVLDDDAPGLQFEPADGLQLEESGATGTYAVRLQFEPSATTTVTISSDDDGVVVDADGGTSGDQKTLTFNASTWSTWRTVVVRAEPDADAASETATLTHAASGAGSGYEGVSAPYAVRVSDSNAARAPTGVVVTAAGRTSLAVRWTPSPEAQGYVVQWRRAGQAWSEARQLTVRAGVVEARIDGLAPGAEYEVRVLGLNQGDPGDPSSSARATPRTLNGAPVVATPLKDETLALGATKTIDLRGAFRDPDDDALVYQALSANTSVVEATATGTGLRLRAVGIGTATVYVWATDLGGLRASQTLQVTVTNRRLSATGGGAPEGRSARVVVRLSLARATSTRVVWSVAADEDAATADADAADLSEMSGETTIEAGETQAEIFVAIADDEEIEPAREWFEVSLWAPDDCCGPAVRARVAVQEGVCDRTPAVRDALRRPASCATPTPAALASIRRLEVSGAGSLQAGDFDGLAGLRTLLLDGNGLERLPDGLFAGLDSLGELSLEDNPGAPFALAVGLERTDADPWAPGSATVRARFALGAPFALVSELSAEPASAGLPETVEVGAGAVSGAPFTVAASTSTLRLSAAPAKVPSTRCGEALCFRGVEAVPGEALTLYRRPPLALALPRLAPLQSGDDLRVALTTLIRPGDGRLRWRASSSDESVATARVSRGHLVVTPELGVEGAVEIVLEAVDEEGFAATQRFEVQVAFHWPAGLRGWRASVLIEAARAAPGEQ